MNICLKSADLVSHISLIFVHKANNNIQAKFCVLPKDDNSNIILWTYTS